MHSRRKQLAFAHILWYTSVDIFFSIRISGIVLMNNNESFTWNVFAGGIGLAIIASSTKLLTWCCGFLPNLYTMQFWYSLFTDVFLAVIKVSASHETEKDKLSFEQLVSLTAILQMPYEDKNSCLKFWAVFSLQSRYELSKRGEFS